MAVQIGQQAPDFSLYNTEKVKITLSSLKDSNVVILFFPLAFTSVCTAELCFVRDHLARFSELDATILGISVDSHFTLARYKADQLLNFNLLSDFNKEVSTAYGAIYSDFAYEMKGVSKRAAFVIDKEGVVRYAEVLDNAGMQPDFDAVKKVLEQISLTV